MAFEIGSVWRRWDPHLHTPDSILNDSYVGGWVAFLAALENQSDVTALGIADYMNIDNYRRIQEERRAGRLANIAFVFPNIEFRITPKTKDDRAINIHLLISPDDPNHAEETENALNRLSFKFNERNYSCQRAQLISLGRATTPNVVSDKEALFEGANQFKIEFDAFRKWYEGEGWLRENSIVAIAAGSNDGASGIQHDDGFKAVRTELYRFSDIIFSGKESDRKFWLGKSHGDEVRKVYGNPKPCLHGSDAHDLQRLLKPDQNRFCWIKANLSFEGLRQTIYEPEERVWIGEEPPSLHDRSRIISSVKLSANDWFESETYRLNSGLVAIIGQKGMGKSAINDLVAYAAGSWQETEKDSFIDRARPYIKGLQIELGWGDGAKTLAEVSGKGQASSKNEVRYLSQKFVERLCADPASNGELTREIESVIFSYLPPTETLNASNFSDLREKRTAGVVAEQRRYQEELRQLHRKISDLYTRRLSIPERREKEQTILKERTGIVAQIPETTSAAEAQIAIELQGQRDELALVIDKVSTQKEKLLRLDRLAESVKAFHSQLDRFWSEVRQDLELLSIPEEHRSKFKPQFLGDTDEPIAIKRIELLDSVAVMEGEEIDPAVGTVKALLKRIEELSALLTADESKRNRIRELQSRIAALDTDLRRLRAEIEAIEGVESEQLSKLRMERRATYYSYFGTLGVEGNILAELYKPLQEYLGLGEQHQERHLDFSIRLNIDVGGWAEKGMRLFNQRKKLPYATLEDIISAANDHLVPAWTSADSQQLEQALNKFMEPYGAEPGATVGNYLKPSQNAVDFFDWLYSTDHISLTYGLRYNGTPLENLSPGTKGIVLLILYLAMDKQDTRPLLIDQPEENLDNESIFNLLSAYFRTAKARRQILLITHNPNLVVNTDADQVVIAQCTKENSGLPHFSYEAGALEDCEGGKSIRHQVCQILEGGAAAFLSREKRYSLD